MENMTIAMHNFKNWYSENVQFSFNLFCDSLTSNGYAEHFTNDAKLFKAVITVNGEVSVLITTHPITFYKEDCKLRVDDIIQHMIDNMNNGQYSIPTMSSEEIGRFANWVANDSLIEKCGLTFDTFTHYIMYEEDFETEVEEIKFLNKTSKIEEIAKELEISSDKIKILTKRLLELVNEGEI